MREPGDYECSQCGESIYLDPPAPRLIDFECPECGEMYPCELEDGVIKELDLPTPEAVRREFSGLMPDEDGLSWKPGTTPAEAFVIALNLWERNIETGENSG